MLRKTRSSIMFLCEFVTAKYSGKIEMKSGVQNGEDVLYHWIPLLLAWNRMSFVKAAFWNLYCLPGLLTLGSRILAAVIRRNLPHLYFFTYKIPIGVFLPNFKKIIEE